MATNSSSAKHTSENPYSTPYLNTIEVSEQPEYPGDLDVETRLESLVRWNAMAMVVRANRAASGIGGHISTFASAATLWEVGFNHFFRGKAESDWGDLIYFQGHASPGVYSRAFLEGRLSEQDLVNFRQELAPGGGLASYPHPWLMPDFWEFPTVSMGLAPINAIYQARFNHYLADRNLTDTTKKHVWALLGDGELDEPESLGAITLAAREQLDNLTFVVNCNLQRLDGPVRGNSKIIQELETAFSGAGWNVIKVIWGSEFDPLIAKDSQGLFAKRVSRLPDGEMQRYAIADGAFIRAKFFGAEPGLAELVKDLSDEQLTKMRRGGHDPRKVYAAFDRARNHNGRPTVILAQTIKGYGLGEAGEGKNTTHKQKQLNEKELRYFRDRFDIPISDDQIGEAPFYRPAEDTTEMQYLRDRRRALGGYIPKRMVAVPPMPKRKKDLVAEFASGTEGREVTTTMVFVRLLSMLLRDPKIGQRIVPIIPDEARTFGMESLFRQFGIYSHVGQLYEPVDRENLLYYREATDGTILEEGITEAGSMSSFAAAGSAYATHGISMIPFFTFYSMFGFQRIGDLIWAAGDMRAKGFLMGATSGRTTLNGEGLQHQDGHSHLAAYTVPNVRAYDPAFAYELAVIIDEGIHAMFDRGEDLIYYITLTNAFYPMPPMPEGVREGIIKGLYKFRSSELPKRTRKAHILASGAIMSEAFAAREILETDYDVAVDIWSLTSYKQLYLDACETERRNRHRPENPPETPYITRQLQNEKGVFIAVSDFVKALPSSIAQWVPGPFTALGTDGFGRSDTKERLRDYFEIDARHIAAAALVELAKNNQVSQKTVRNAMDALKIDPDKPDPVTH